MISLDGLAEFVAVAEAGGFTAAARRSGLSKSLLSDRIRALEDRLDARLFDRTTRSVRLTEAGGIYLDVARRILAEAEAAEAAIQDLSGTPRGHLRIGTTASFAGLYLAAIIPGFRARHPGITLDLLTEESVIDPTRAGIDVAIRFGPSPPDGTVARRLGDIPYVICAAPDYLARSGRPLEPADLARHAIIAGPGSISGAAWRLARGRDHVTLNPDPVVATNNGTVHRALLLAGNGIGLVSRLSVWNDLEAGALEAVLPGWQPEAIERVGIWLVLPDNRAIPPKVRVFVDHLVAELGRHPAFARP